VNNKILIAGHRGLVGKALVKAFKEHDVVTATRQQVDLSNQQQTFDYLQSIKPDLVIVAAAKVGGIHANNAYPAQFIYENIAIAANCIHGSYLAGVKNLLFLGSSCIYPKHAPQPLTEECLLTSTLEPTNEAYAIAKIAGLKMAQFYSKQYGVNYKTLMPTNLYGPGDNYHPENSHVLPGLIRRFHEAKVNAQPYVVAWGTGSPLREFMHSDDLADACLFLSSHIEQMPDLINVGSGQEVSIKQLTQMVARIVGYAGEIVWDSYKPDGTPRKLMDCSKLNQMGWTAKIPLEQGIAHAYSCFLAEQGYIN
jgi:GDP-L-fucose synthase